jgi:hypothetical protein
LPGTQYEAAMTTKQEPRKPVLSLPAPNYASIDISIAGRTEPVHEREIPVICAACGNVQTIGGVATVKITPLSAEAHDAARKDMLILCVYCVGSPGASDALMRIYYPALDIAEGTSPGGR